MNCIAAFAEYKSRNSVILRNSNISALTKICKCNVNSVGACTDYFNFTVI